MNHVKKFRGDAADYQPFVSPYSEPPFSGFQFPSDDPKYGCLGIILGILLAALLLWLLPSCSASRRCSVSTSVNSSQDVSEKKHEGEVLDSLYAAHAVERTRNTVERSHDTVIVHTTTVVREVDSAELSRYGILLEGQKRAYLINEKELRERISFMELAFTDSMRVLRDSLRSLRSRDYSLLETSKSSVEESETSEVRKPAPTSLWPVWLTIALVVILYVIHYRHRHS